MVYERKVNRRENYTIEFSMLQDASMNLRSNQDDLGRSIIGEVGRVYYMGMGQFF
jgi:hypothetical protein